jgi:tetratricopeptide (TPR) repeat protein
MFDFLKKAKPDLGSHNFMAPHVRADQPAGAPKSSSYTKVMNFCLYALVLLVPLFFSSMTPEVREFNKQNLLFFAVALMMGAWVVRLLTTRRMSWVKTSLDFVLLGYLGVYLISSLTSIDKVSSFLGYYGRFTGSFLSVLTLVLLYFFVVNNVRSARVLAKMTKYLTAGLGLTLVYSLLQLFGWYILPFAYTHDRGFNPIGSLAGLAVFAALSVVFFQWLFLSHPNLTKYKRWGLVFLTVVAVMIMFLINAFVAWLVLALGITAFLALSMTLNQNQTSGTWMWKPMSLLIISVLFLAFQFLPPVVNPRNLVNINLPIEIQLSNSTTWTLVKNSISAGPKEAIVGSGPGTTGIVFGGIKPQDLNNTVVWSLNFDRASSEIANIGIETGLLGLIAFEIAALLFLVYGLFFLLRKTQNQAWMYAMGFYVMWLMLYVLHFFYFFNMTFAFMFWLSLALFMAISHWSEQQEEDQDLSFEQSPRSALSWMFASLIMLAVILVGGFFQAAVYGGEMAYASGVKELNKETPNLAAASDSFARAITLNPYRDSYYLAYGQSLIFRAAEEANKEKPDTTQIQAWMSDLITVGQEAVKISPQKSSNWQALAQFYANIKPLVAGADKFVIDSLKQAIERDGNNPALHYQLGQAYFGASVVPDTESKEEGATKTDPEMMKNAQAELNRAIELKSDLPEFYIQLARVLEADNKLDDAKKKMDEATALFGYNADILFENGRLTFNKKDYQAAEEFFLAVVELVPTHANAHYSLGLLYQQKGDKEKAIASFEKTREITGPNEDLDNLINSLKAGQPTQTQTIPPAGQ